jgi:hypothetical protein
MDRLIPSQTLEACAPGSILIPGFRLWRSSVVTIGAQRADRIAVLPNMRGIIADFKEVQRPVGLADGGKAVKEELRVWTSEGVDTARERIMIAPPKGERTCSRETTAAASP